MIKIIDSAITKHGKFFFPRYDVGVGDSLREYGEFSEAELTLMLSFIKEGDTVLDIGSNIGAFTIPFAKKVGFKGKVYAFEPQSFIFRILKENVKINKLSNIEIFNIGLGSSDYNIKLRDFDYGKKGVFGGIGLPKKYKNEFSATQLNTTSNVKVKKVDGLLNLKKCNFLKIDVETMELDVLKGAKKITSFHRPIIWYENHVGAKCKVNQYMLNQNYRLFWVVTNLFNKYNYFNSQKKIYGKQVNTYNVLAIPKEKVEKYDVSFLEEIINNNLNPTKVISFIK